MNPIHARVSKVRAMAGQKKDHRTRVHVQKYIVLIYSKLLTKTKDKTSARVK